MDNGFILTASFGLVFVAGRYSFFHFAAISPSEKGDILNLPATEVNAHHEAGA